VKCGFRPAARENFPMKIDQDCLTCALYLRRQEQTVAIRIRRWRAASAEFTQPATVFA
jgi:hypothetical protein